MRRWVGDINTFHEAIWKQIVFDEDGRQHIFINLDDFRVFGFIDCMAHEACTPGTGPINDNEDRRPEAYGTQRAFFTRYGKIHGLKSQIVILPNGMICHAWIHSVAQNDRGMINLSGLEEYMRDILTDIRLGEGRMLPALFGDSIYMPSEVIIIKGDNDGIYFNKMNRLREKIEHEFGLFQSLWKHMTQIHTLRILRRNNRLHKRIMVYWLVTNIYTCFNGNTTSVRFNLRPPSVAEYLNM